MTELEEKLRAFVAKTTDLIIDEDDSEGFSLFINNLPSEDSNWCYYDKEENEIRINKEFGIKISLVFSDKPCILSFNSNIVNCIKCHDINTFIKYYNFLQENIILLNELSKKIINNKRLSDMTTDFKNG